MLPKDSSNVNEWLTSSNNHFSAPMISSESEMSLINVPPPIVLDASMVQIHSHTKKITSPKKVIYAPQPQDDWDKIETIAATEELVTRNKENIVGPMDIMPMDNEHPRRCNRKKDANSPARITRTRYRSPDKFSSKNSSEAEKKATKPKQNMSNVKKMKKKFNKLNKANKKVRKNLETNKSKKKSRNKPSLDIPNKTTDTSKHVTTNKSQILERSSGKQTSTEDLPPYKDCQEPIFHRSGLHCLSNQESDSTNNTDDVHISIKIGGSTITNILIKQKKDKRNRDDGDESDIPRNKRARVNSLQNPEKFNKISEINIESQKINHPSDCTKSNITHQDFDNKGIAKSSTQNTDHNDTLQECALCAQAEKDLGFKGDMQEKTDVNMMPLQPVLGTPLMEDDSCDKIVVEETPQKNKENIVGPMDIVFKDPSRSRSNRKKDANPDNEYNNEHPRRSRRIAEKKATKPKQNIQDDWDKIETIAATEELVTRNKENIVGPMDINQDNEHPRRCNRKKDANSPARITRTRYRSPDKFSSKNSSEAEKKATKPKQNMSNVKKTKKKFNKLNKANKKVRKNLETNKSKKKSRNKPSLDIPNKTTDTSKHVTTNKSQILERSSGKQTSTEDLPPYKDCQEPIFHRSGLHCLSNQESDSTNNTDDVHISIKIGGSTITNILIKQKKDKRNRDDGDESDIPRNKRARVNSLQNPENPEKFNKISEINIESQKINHPSDCTKSNITHQDFDNKGIAKSSTQNTDHNDTLQECALCAQAEKDLGFKGDMQEKTDVNMMPLQPVLGTPLMEDDSCDKIVVEETPQKNMSLQKPKTRSDAQNPGRNDNTKGANNLNQSDENNSDSQISISVINISDTVTVIETLQKGPAVSTPMSSSRFVNQIQHNSKPMAKNLLNFNSDGLDDPKQTLCAPTTQEREFMEKAFEKTPVEIKDPIRKPLMARREGVSNTSNFCIAGSLLSAAELTKIKILCKNKGWKFSDKYTDQVTHLVVAVDAEFKSKKRTLKYLCAVAASKWIVSFGWIKECFRRKEVPDETPFEALDTQGEPGPARSRQARYKLFDGFTFFLMPPFTSIDVNTLKHLITWSGGRVVNTLQDVRVTGREVKILLADAKTTQKELFTCMAMKEKVVPVNYQWALNCLGMYSLCTNLDWLLCPAALLSHQTSC